MDGPEFYNKTILPAVDDFQPLSKAANDAKCEHCKKMQENQQAFRRKKTRP